VGLVDLSLWMMVGFFCTLPFRRNAQPPQSNPPETGG
jgi:hypothetical protein